MDSAMDPSRDPPLVLLCEFHCTATGEKEDRSIAFPMLPNSVRDIKEYIQSHFSIPKCLQQLSMNDQPLLDSLSISDLYIRSEDRLSVSYLCEANVEFISNFVHSSLQSLANLLKTGLPSSDQLDAEFKDVLEGHGIGFHQMIYQMFLPWASHCSEANRQLFIQEGGLRYSIEIYSRLLTKPFEERSEDSKQLETLLLSLLWNFSETRSARLAVVREGGFSLMMQSLMHYHGNQFLERYRIHEVFDQAVGCISNLYAKPFFSSFSELECCQMPLAQNTDAMERLLAFATQGSALNNFTHMLIANCLFRLSHSLEAHKYLADSKILQPTLQFYDRYNSQPSYHPNLAVKYVLCLVFARLLLFSCDLVPVKCQRQIVNLQFVSETTPAAITAVEERYQYNWITAVPFVEMLYAPLLEETKNRSSRKTDSPLKVECQKWSMQIALLGLRAEMERAILRKLVVEQGLLDFISCLPWGMPHDWQDSCLTIVRLFRKDHSQPPVPRLSSIARAVLARNGVPTKLGDQ